MLKKNYLTVAVIAVCAAAALAQDDAEMRLRKALEGRQVLVKIDLPAIDSGINMVFDDTNVTFDQANYNRLIKEYGPAIPKDHKARITGVHIAGGGVVIELDGGGSPARDWFAGNVRLVEPAPLARSDREIELERQLQRETNITTINVLKNELEVERQSRLLQDERNRDTFQQVSRYRGDYLKANRKNWGSKLIITIRSKQESTSMRDVVKALAKYVELLPRESTGT